MATPRLFGTDGIRGPFGAPPLDRDTIRRLGAALGEILTEHGTRGPVLVAGDTRSSTPEICHWIADGLSSREQTFLFGGVLPTPAIARLVESLELPTGVAVSASHNPHSDNGVKLIGEDGAKWEIEREREIEERLARLDAPPVRDLHLRPDPLLADSYLQLLRGKIPALKDASGLRIALDGANGAAAELAPRLFSQLGAELVILAARPDGQNINRGCGSTAPEALAEATLLHGCDVGFAFDGDADRVIAADESGRILDGDAILYLLATRMRNQGLLKPPRIVATTMSNIGLELGLAQHGVDLLRCDVGDRFVVAALRREGLVLGGEQSGHIVHLGLGPTGDGIQTAMLVIQVLLEAGEALSALLEDFQTYPQVLVNVPVSRKPDLLTLPSVASAADAVTGNLAGRGRLVLRYSGTEPLARIMIEGPRQDEIDRLAAQLAAVVESEIGTGS